MGYFNDAALVHLLIFGIHQMIAVTSITIRAPCAINRRVWLQYRTLKTKFLCAFAINLTRVSQNYGTYSREVFDSKKSTRIITEFSTSSRIRFISAAIASTRSADVCNCLYLTRVGEVDRKIMHPQIQRGLCFFFDLNYKFWKRDRWADDMCRRNDPIVLWLFMLWRMSAIKYSVKLCWR